MSRKDIYGFSYLRLQEPQSNMGFVYVSWFYTYLIYPFVLCTRIGSEKVRQCLYVVILGKS